MRFISAPPNWLMAKIAKDFGIQDPSLAVPSPAGTEAEARDPSRPFVVKMHAQWCPVCLLTKGTWAAVQQTHAGSANLVVFDFTNEKTTEASRADAKRLGLEKFFDENGGVSGVVYVLDGRTKEVRAELVGEHNAAAYGRAIEAANAAWPAWRKRATSWLPSDW